MHVHAHMQNPSVCVCVKAKEKGKEEWGRQRAKEDFVNSASSAGGLGVFPLPRTYGVGVLLRRASRGGGAGHGV